jgi:polyhydroxyalkanoate synthase
VIYRNKLIELIHYTPAGDKTFETPLLVIAPWINKYYILDLGPEKSFVKWATDQGHAVFMISWVNPDASMKDIGFEDYMHDGILAALAAVEKQTGAKQTNVIGYCIGGTLLSMTLAWLKAKGQSARVKSATFFTTLIDFEQSGDLKLFVDEEQLSKLHERMEKQGFLDANSLKATFNLLRANDLIWSFVINNYLMGREPFPFDLLYWNSDSTNLPARMHEYYLRHMYLKNELCKPGALSFEGVKMDMGTIDTPAYFLSTREDHIAPWKATFAGSKLFSGDVTFTLSASGHIAGVVNAPIKNKYCYWTASPSEKPDAWLEHAKQIEGSWWPHWQVWIEKFTGEKVDAVDPAKGPMKALVPAPGTYVRKKA